MRKSDFAHVYTKMQICYAVTAQLISTFVFTTQYNLCVGPQKPSETLKTGFLLSRLQCLKTGEAKGHLYNYIM